MPSIPATVTFIGGHSPGDQFPGDCPCGWDRHLSEVSEQAHVQRHFQWAHGPLVPARLEPHWWTIAVIPAGAPAPWSRLAYQTARLAQREGGYDFPSFPSPAAAADGAFATTRALLYRHGSRVRGYLAISTCPAPARLEPSGDIRQIADSEVTERTCVELIWTAYHWRRQGIASALIRAAAGHTGTTPAEIAWTTPFTHEGRALARSTTAGSIWLG